MWSCKQLSPPQTLHSSLVVGRGPGGTLGDTGPTWSGRASWIWALFLVSLCPPRDANTPRQPQQGRLVLASWTGHPSLRVLGHLLPCGSHMAAPCFCSHYAPSLGPSRPVVCPLPSLPSSEPPPPGNPPGISAIRLLGGSRPQGGSTPSCPQAGVGSVGPPRESLGEHPTAFQRLSPATCLPLLLSARPPTHSLVAGQQAAWVAGSQGASRGRSWLVLPLRGPCPCSSWRRSSRAHCQETCSDTHPGPLPGLLAPSLPTHLVPEGLPSPLGGTDPGP